MSYDTNSIEVSPGCEPNWLNIIQSLILPTHCAKARQALKGNA